jgi:hypothetical protein
MKPMKYYFLSLFFLFSILYSSYAQEEVNRKWNLAIGYSMINNFTMFNGNLGELTIEGNRKLNKWIETGVYAGYSTCRSEKKIIENGEVTGGSHTTSQVVSWGIHAYWRLSSLFLEENSRLVIRMITKPGGIIIIPKEAGAEPSGFHVTFRAGAGIDYRLFRKMGIFGEYTYGFGDGIYRARDEFGFLLNTPQKHIGSFRFGINIPL